MRWTQDEIDTSIQLAAAGKNSVQIAAQLKAEYSTSRTPGSVLLCLRRHDQEAHQRRDDTRRLKYHALRALALKMADNGAMMSTIARAIGVAHKTVARAVPMDQRATNEPRQSPFQVWLDAQPGYKQFKEPPVTAAGKSFADKGDDECSWWIGDDSEGKARFCAAPRDKTRPCSYCTMHYAASIIPGEEA